MASPLYTIIMFTYVGVHTTNFSIPESIPHAIISNPSREYFYCNLSEPCRAEIIDGREVLSIFLSIGEPAIADDS